MQDKLNAIRLLNKGEPLQKVADEYSVSRCNVGEKPDQS